MSDKYIKVIFAAAIVLLGGVTAYLVHGDRQKKAQLREITAVVSAASEQLKTALDKGPAPGDLAAADANLQSLRAMDTSRQLAAADAAEHYLISVRTIVRARGDSLRLSQQAAADRQALVSFMGSPRSEAWFRHAMDMKKKVEQDHYELGVAYKAMDEVFFSLPDDAKRLVPITGAPALVEISTLPAARQRFQQEADRAAAQLAEVRRIPDR